MSVTVRVKENGKAAYYRAPFDNAKYKKYSRDILYPAELPSFEEISRGGHSDIRAVVYTYYRYDIDRQRPFSKEELSADDFAREKESAYDVLLREELIEDIETVDEIQQIFLKTEIVSLLRERGLSVKGRKQELAERLANSGFVIDRSIYEKTWFRFTEKGKAAARQREEDKREAIRQATDALKELNYDRAVSAYRAFDNKWGFIHTSGKKHTIFANYDVRFSQFAFIEQYSMLDLFNSKEYKASLRACLLAGLMRGDQDKYNLRREFESICSEQIDCPGIVELFGLSNRDAEERSIKQAMRDNIDADIGYALEYYISHVLYLSRQAS